MTKREQREVATFKIARADVMRAVGEVTECGFRSATYFTKTKAGLMPKSRVKATRQREDSPATIVLSIGRLAHAEREHAKRHLRKFPQRHVAPLLVLRRKRK